MLTIYIEQDLISDLRSAAEEGTSMKDYYWRSWYFARKRFTKEDQLFAVYLYDMRPRGLRRPSAEILFRSGRSGE